MEHEPILNPSECNIESIDEYRENLNKHICFINKTLKNWKFDETDKYIPIDYCEKGVVKFLHSLYKKSWICIYQEWRNERGGWIKFYKPTNNMLLKLKYHLCCWFG